MADHCVEKVIPLAQVDARCKLCGWTGRAIDLRRTTIHEVEIGGTETDAKVVSERDGVIVRCPACPGRLGDQEFGLPEGHPAGHYRIDLREGL